MPRQIPPSVPQKPWTEIAPHGSSTFSTRSLNRTPKHTTAPAIAPIAIDDVALTNAHGAVMATNPASMPLHAIVTSGLPNIQYHRTSATADPLHAARFVFTTMPAIRRSVAPSVEPGLNPIQPNNRM